MSPRPPGRDLMDQCSWHDTPSALWAVLTDRPGHDLTLGIQRSRRQECSPTGGPAPASSTHRTRWSIPIRESAEQVSVSRQPADQLTRSKAWRDPVERVASVDLSAIEAMKGLWERTTKVTLVKLSTRSTRVPTSCVTTRGVAADPATPGCPLARLVDVDEPAETAEQSRNLVTFPRDRRHRQLAMEQVPRAADPGADRLSTVIGTVGLKSV